ncbi:MAG: signal peptide peptidase SppA [Gammaproteobacteria bacterium]|nr:signal peptide peptidase SppA [Gammaproteobacteria bacterium]
MGTVRKILLGVWRGLDGLRKLLHLLLLLALFGFLVGVLYEASPTMPQRAALVVAPRGRLVEQLSGDPVERALENAQGEGVHQTLLWNLVSAIRAGAKDPRIGALVLDLDDMDHAGLPMLEELARAIQVFRASGKPVLAFGTAFDQDQYYLAAQANQVDLDPTGYVLIRGFSRYSLYFAGLLKKLGVHVHVFRVGKYKSAVEIFTRQDMSKADRAQSTAYLDAQWTTYQREVAAARGLPAGAIAQYVDTLPKTVSAADGDAAEVALKAHLVSALIDKHQFEQRVIHLVGADAHGTFNAVGAGTYAKLVRSERAAPDASEPRVAVIVADGDILDGREPPGAIGGDSLSRLIRTARTNSHIKAVVLRIDSPGGSVTAAEEIYHALVALRASGKPLVVSMGDYAASGGYYIAAPANEIYASPATLTGSIGIFAIIPTFKQALRKFGIGSDGVGTTPLAGQMSPGQPLNAESKLLIRSQINRGYAQFVQRVAEGRHLTDAQVNAIGQGHVWAGAAARHIGLVDHLGTLEDAEHAAASLAKLEHYRVQFLHRRRSWTQLLLERAQARAAFAAVSLFGPKVSLPGFGALAGSLSPYARELSDLTRFGARGKLYAYCFCTQR